MTTSLAVDFFNCLFILAGSCYVLMMIGFIIGWTRLRKYDAATTEFSTSVSIIVPARNEEDTIIHCIEDIVKQRFPKELMELIVVNDNSSDRTSFLVKQYISKHAIPNGVDIKIIDLEEDKNTNSFKKKAILEGIRQAKGALIVTTDADCRMNDLWLSTTVSYYEKNRPKFISAPVSYHEEKNWFGKFQTLEFLGLIGIGAGGIKINIPTMCNGANLAYTKEVFWEVNGFEGISDLASGDDTFLMLKIAKKYREGIHFIKSFDAIVYTTPKESLREFTEQRKRWASKGAKYNSKKVIFVGVLTYVFNFLIFVSGVFSIFYSTFAPVFISALIAKITVEFIFLYLVTSFFKRRQLLLCFFQEQLLYILYVVWIGAEGSLSKYTWKGRAVK